MRHIATNMLQSGFDMGNVVVITMYDCQKTKVMEAFRQMGHDYKVHLNISTVCQQQLLYVKKSILIYAYNVFFSL